MHNAIVNVARIVYSSHSDGFVGSSLWQCAAGTDLAEAPDHAIRTAWPRNMRHVGHFGVLDGGVLEPGSGGRVVLENRVLVSAPKQRCCIVHLY